MRVLPGMASARARHALLLLLLAVAAPCLTADSAAAPDSPAERGRRLFDGRDRMQNGGPPCSSCHTISSLPFPGGGAVGPDLTGITQTLGPEGTDVALQTLFFPTMMPLYEKRPLAVTEQQALKAFFDSAGTTPAAATATTWLAALAAAGFVLLAATTWLAWRNRLRGVRAPLVSSAQRR